MVSIAGFSVRASVSSDKSQTDHYSTAVLTFPPGYIYWIAYF